MAATFEGACKSLPKDVYAHENNSNFENMYLCITKKTEIRTIFMESKTILWKRDYYGKEDYNNRNKTSFIYI
jgi:hypothetical protein